MDAKPTKSRMADLPISESIVGPEFSKGYAEGSYLANAASGGLAGIVAAAVLFPSSGSVVGFGAELGRADGSAEGPGASRLVGFRRLVGTSALSLNAGQSCPPTTGAERRSQRRDQVQRSPSRRH